MDYYVVSSLELHLFFGRIMKEHSFFLEVGYTAANPNYKEEAKKFKEAFTSLLYDVVECSKGVIGDEGFEAGEVVTQYTLLSEKNTSMLTGAGIDSNLTMEEKKLWDTCRKKRGSIDSCLVQEVQKINQRALKLVKALIRLKEQTLENVLNCNMFTINYPLLIKHIIREAKLYARYIEKLESGQSCQNEDLRGIELFWNQIMMEHALFIRGLLDPTENELIFTANKFAGEYAKLLAEAKNMLDKTMPISRDKVLAQTMQYRDFKATGTKGINECSIQGLILPLLADHVLREANHYIRLLKESK